MKRLRSSLLRSVFWIAVSILTLGFYWFGGELLAAAVRRFARLVLPLPVAFPLFAIVFCLLAGLFLFADYRRYYGRDDR